MLIQYKKKIRTKGEERTEILKKLFDYYKEETEKSPPKLKDDDFLKAYKKHEYDPQELLQAIAAEAVDPGQKKARDLWDLHRKKIEILPVLKRLLKRLNVKKINKQLKAEMDDVHRTVDRRINTPGLNNEQKETLRGIGEFCYKKSYNKQLMKALTLIVEHPPKEYIFEEYDLDLIESLLKEDKINLDENSWITPTTNKLKAARKYICKWINDSKNSEEIKKLFSKKAIPNIANALTFDRGSKEHGTITNELKRAIDTEDEDDLSTSIDDFVENLFNEWNQCDQIYAIVEKYFVNYVNINSKKLYTDTYNMISTAAKTGPKYTKSKKIKK